MMGDQATRQGNDRFGLLKGMQLQHVWFAITHRHANSWLTASSTKQMQQMVAACYELAQQPSNKVPAEDRLSACFTCGCKYGKVVQVITDRRTRNNSFTH